MRRRIAKRVLIAAIAASALRAAADPGLQAGGEVVILDYHSFLGSKTSSLDFPEEDFAAQIDRYLAVGYNFVTLEDAISGRTEGIANLVLTIDDGNHSVYAAVKDVLLPRGIRPDLFIYPAVIGRESHFLTADQLRELAAAGCGIGAHGYHHDYVTDGAWERDPKDFMREIALPGPALERITGARPGLFAFPFGLGSKRAEEELAKAGYLWAFGAADALRPVRFDDPVLDRYFVPRTIVYHWNREAVYEALAARLARRPGAVAR
jgi:peptidoglycan/xylan/chitin deacetylase (PgdA/CDA1 family)